MTGPTTTRTKQKTPKLTTQNAALSSFPPHQIATTTLQIFLPFFLSFLHKLPMHRYNPHFPKS
jgi:hypothetical protein